MNLNEKGIFFPNGANSFATGDQTGELFQISITNSDTSAENQVIAITNGRGYTAAELTAILGVTVDAVIKDGEIISTVDKKVSVACIPNKAIVFTRSLQDKPQRFSGFSLDVTNAAQLQQELKFFKVSTFGGVRSMPSIYPSVSKNNTQVNDKLVHVPTAHMQLDADTICLMTVVSGVATITLFPEGSYDAAKLLDAEAKKEWSANPFMKREVKN